MDDYVEFGLERDLTLSVTSVSILHRRIQRDSNAQKNFLVQ